MSPEQEWILILNESSDFICKSKKLYNIDLLLLMEDSSQIWLHEHNGMWNIRLF